MVYRSLFFRQKNLPVHFIPLKKIPQAFQKMVLKLEDDTFYSHWGIEPGAMRSAWKRNQRAGFRKYGGSTITQQLARTLYLIPKKWYLRKYLEAWLAVEMDLVLSKDRILEYYLNYTEWGKGIYGIGQAARYYFGKDLQSLSIDEMKRLAAILPNPLRFKPHSLDNKIGFLSRYKELDHFTDMSNLSYTNLSDESVLSNFPSITNIETCPDEIEFIYLSNHSSHSNTEILDVPEL